MTIQEAVNTLDELKPNAYSFARKVGWLSTLDGQVYREVLCHFDIAPDSFSEYDPKVDQDRELLIGQPYGEEVYTAYLQAAVDRENGEMGKYNQSVSQFNAAYLRYVNDCIRTLTPRPVEPFRF